MPRRMQRSRQRGWRMPANAVYVGRPTKWGNPHRPSDYTIQSSAQAYAVADFRSTARERLAAEPDWLRPLRWKHLVCWCRLDQPCHADVLLELANR